MSRRAQFKLEARFIVTPATMESIRLLCSPSEKLVYVSTWERVRVHTLKGVLGTYCDVLLPDSSFIEEPYSWVCEIGRKYGSYDNNQRWRLCFRTWGRRYDSMRGRKPTWQYPSDGLIMIEEDYPDSLAICCLYEGGPWAQQFPRRQWRDDGRDKRSLFMHHHARYFAFIPVDDARQTAEMWALLPHSQRTDDLAVLSRTIYATLHDLATQLGWVRPTIKQRRQLGLDEKDRQWYLLSDMRLRNLSPSGAGEYTCNAASGRIQMCEEESQGYIRTAYGLEEVE